MPPEIQEFFEGLSVWTVIVWLVAIGISFPILRKLWRLFKQLADFLDDVMGEPARPGVEARPGLMERVMRVEHELFPNSGRSLRDQTNRMEEKLDRDNARITELAGQVEDVVGKVDDVAVNVGGLTERVDEHITQSTQIIETLKGDNHEGPV
ncbi:MAG TPA: hypothetical protein VN041_15625 [Microbacterium sp.]|nr:hypothetical protein [Microbacterium sp.]